MVRRADIHRAAAPRHVDLEVPEVALVVVAHPDDAEFQCGGTLAKWARLGARIHHLVLTDGSKGTWDATADQTALVATRRREQQRAADLLGGGEVTFLDQVDGELRSDVPLRDRVAGIIRQVRPGVVLGHDPWTRYRLHPDHAAAGRLCVEGIVAARDPWFARDLLDDGLEPHRPSALLLFEPDVADHAESFTPDDLDRKVAALLAHESQHETTHLHHSRSADATDPYESFRRREHDLAVAAGAWAGVGLAEAFHLIDDQL